MADASPPDRERLAARAGRSAGRRGPRWPESAMGSSYSTTLARNGRATGETFTFRLFPNRFVYSRDQNRASAPYFTIELGPEDRRPPTAPTGLRVEPGTALLPAGEALVSWVTPARCRSRRHARLFRVARRHAAAARADPAGRRSGGASRDASSRPEAARLGRAHKLSVRAVDAAGNRGPEATASIRVYRAELPRRCPRSSRSRGPAAPRDRHCPGLPVQRSRSSTSWTRSIPSPAS